MTTATGWFVTGPAGPLFVDDGGADGGRLPVVLVHSFGGSTAQWAPQLAHLRGTRRAIALDLRGHGQSAAPGDDDYAVESLAADIGAVVDCLGLPAVVLVGHGLGAKAALEFAGAHPDRVAGLVLAAAPARIPGPGGADDRRPGAGLRRDERGDQRPAPDRRERRRPGAHRPRRRAGPAGRRAARHRGIAPPRPGAGPRTLSRSDARGDHARGRHAGRHPPPRARRTSTR